MNNAARHVLGLVAGVVATPVTVALLAFGADKFAREYRVLGDVSVLAALALAGAGLILGVLCGSRVSPLGSLVPGAVYLLYGVLWVFDPYVVSDYTADLLPENLELSVLALGSFGLFLVLGVLLVAASVPPSRWRSRPKPPSAPYPQLPFATPGPGQGPVAGPPPGRNPADGPPPPPLPYQPGS